MAGKVEFKKPRKSNVTDVSGGKVSGWREWPTMSNATARTKNFPRSLPLVQPKNKAFITLPPSLRPPSLSHSHSLTLYCGRQCNFDSFGKRHNLFTNRGKLT